MLPAGSVHQETCGGFIDGDGGRGDCKKKGAKVGRKCIQQSSSAGGGDGRQWGDGTWHGWGVLSIDDDGGCVVP